MQTIQYQRQPLSHSKFPDHYRLAHDLTSIPHLSSFSFFILFCIQQYYAPHHLESFKHIQSLASDSIIQVRFAFHILKKRKRGCISRLLAQLQLSCQSIELFEARGIVSFYSFPPKIIKLLLEILSFSLLKKLAAPVSRMYYPLVYNSHCWRSLRVLAWGQSIHTLISQNTSSTFLCRVFTHRRSTIFPYKAVKLVTVSVFKISSTQTAIPSPISNTYMLSIASLPQAASLPPHYESDNSCSSQFGLFYPLLGNFHPHPFPHTIKFLSPVSFITPTISIAPGSHYSDVPVYPVWCAIWTPEMASHAASPGFQTCQSLPSCSTKNETSTCTAHSRNVLHTLLSNASEAAIVFLQFLSTLSY